MTSSKEVRYVTLQVVSLLTYVFELAINCILLVYLASSFDTVWLVLTFLALALPSVVIQVVSYTFHFRRDVFLPRTRSGEALVIIAHLLHLALPWRYTRLLLSHVLTLDARELRQSFVLRIATTFTSSMPLLFLHAYLMLTRLDDFSPTQYWYLIAACCATLTSASWSIATYKKQPYFCCALAVAPPSWTAILLRFLWRLGETVARILTLALFSIAHGLWLFMVVGFHWMTMFLLLFVDQSLQTTDADSLPRAVLAMLAKSFVCVFSHVNLTQQRSRFALVFFYVICCLESVALLSLFMVYDEREEYRTPFALTVAGGYIAALVFALAFYNCFHAEQAADAKLRALHVRPTLVNLHCCALCSDDVTATAPSALEETANGSPPRIEVEKKKPWLQISSCPNPGVFAPLDNTSDRSSTSDANSVSASKTYPKMHTNGSLGVDRSRHLLRLDAATLASTGSGSQCKCSFSGSDVSLMRLPLTHGSVPPLPPRRLKTRPPQNGGGISNVTIEWDDCDMQVRETPEGASNPETLLKESPRGNKSDAAKDASFARSTLDHGYFSTLSISSKDAANALKSNFEMTSRAKSSTHLHPQRYVLSDHETASSSFSTTSSRFPMLNCRQCGHCVAIDDVSMYSVTSTSASATSSAHLKKLQQKINNKTSIKSHAPPTRRQIINVNNIHNIRASVNVPAPANKRDVTRATSLTSKQSGKTSRKSTLKAVTSEAQTNKLKVSESMKNKHAGVSSSRQVLEPPSKGAKSSVQSQDATRGSTPTFNRSSGVRVAHKLELGTLIQDCKADI